MTRFSSQNLSPWRLCFSVARAGYHRLPLKYAQKRRIKNIIYKIVRTTKYAGTAISSKAGMGADHQHGARAPLVFAATPGKRVAGSHVDGVQAYSDQLAISVIIPVYNELDHTLQCLEAIADAPPSPSFEIIVVDDGSRDQTPVELSRRDDIVYVRNDTNIGFIRTCNRGAATAKGKYLLFLNNDTQVLPGWADELYATFEFTANAGLVGSKLLYPDGTLQEAGGIIWEDGSGWNYGRGENPHKPEFNYLRDTDYVSGASIMVPKALFEQIGGFDEHYLPAYYEDTDLAFKVRQYGLRVLYQPLSRVIHHEGITSGTDMHVGVKSNQARNEKKFFERWQRDLVTHGSPGHPIDKITNRTGRPHALVIDSFTPTPDRDSGSIDTVHWIRLLSDLSFRVTFVPDDLKLFNPYTEDLQRIGTECLYTPFTKSIELHLKNRGKRYDLVILNRLENAVSYMKSVRKYCPNAKIVFNTVDVQHIRTNRQAEVEQSSLLRRWSNDAKDTELQLMREADATVVLSSAEYASLVKEISREKLFLIPFIREVMGRKSGFDERRDLLFVGGFKHQPNVDAVIYFVHEIFPLVKREIPDVKLHIVGSHPTPDVLELASADIIVVGYVEDLANQMDHRRLSVAPLRYGAGIKGKVVSSLSYGLPCVASPMAVEGMELDPGNNILVAEDPKSFAQAIASLYSEGALWRRISDNGLEYVERRYSMAAARINFSRMLAEIGARPFYGFCNVCGAKGPFEVDSDNFRESMHCSECGASARMRCLSSGILHSVKVSNSVLTIRDLANRKPNIKLLDTDNFSPINELLKGQNFYTSTIYLPHKENGRKIGKGVWNVDLMNIPFDDESYDIIITSDVMEHVRRDVLAHREILRCLKPGGRYVFTVPYVATWPKNQVRVDTTGDSDVFLMEKEYHGDPLNEDGVLVYRIFGRQLLCDLKDIGFSEVKFKNIVDPAAGILGDGFWICTK